MQNLDFGPMAFGQGRLRGVHRLALALAGASAIALAGYAAPSAAQSLDERVAAVNADVVAWRRDIHQHPELGNQEVRTAALVAEHLRSLGFDEVRTGVAHTGVVGILHGARPGKMVALRADMDALPIREATGLPFASVATAETPGGTVPVMHACGHDAHVAMLMGAAEVLAGMRDQFSGSIMFIFQPAEEGVAGETAGALLMLQEGLFSPRKPDAVFGLHVEPGPVGSIEVRSGGFLSSATALRINLTGRQTHGARPWEGTDLINLSADIVKSLTTISARQVNVFSSPNVATIASIQAGNRNNILPGSAVLEGTVRTYDLSHRDQIKALIDTSVGNLAETYGAQADVTFQDTTLVTYNDPALLEEILPTLRSVAGPPGVNTDASRRAAAEDFSFFQAEVPGVYYILGSTPNFTTKAAAPSNHSDRFDIDEAVLPLGVKSHVAVALSVLADGTE